METFYEGLTRMLLRLEVVTLQENPNAVLIFAAACAIIGILAVFLDLALFMLRGQSLLKLKHGKNTFLFLVSWAFGSFVIGYIGQVAKIFQVSLMASAIVGFSWPLIFTDWLNKIRESEVETEPEQQIGVEE